jgi:hypothetical protein
LAVIIRSEKEVWVSGSKFERRRKRKASSVHKRRKKPDKLKNHYELVSKSSATTRTNKILSALIAKPERPMPTISMFVSGAQGPAHPYNVA